jgi:uncharacterized 2Fe-2S/4Fe-4S cluster protein (DUF4445 family)
VAAGSSVLEAAQKCGVAIDAPCAGNGTCGKCVVTLVSGELESERNRHLADEDYAAGKRLACVSRVAGDAEIYVPPSLAAYRNRIRVDNEPSAGARNYRELLRARGFAPNTNIQSVPVSVGEPSLDDPMADRERFLAALGGPHRVSLAALRKLPLVMREAGYAFHALVREAEGETPAIVLDVAADELTPFGIAVDIGTTSVSALLVDLANGDIMASANAGNAQICYGADIIHRIIESAKPGGAERLHRAIIDDCLVPLIGDMCAAAHIPAGAVMRASFTGNTTMMHFLAGVYADHLRREPYVPAFFELGGLRGGDLELGIHADAQLCIAPSVGSYVGGDITAGAFASAMADSEALSLFIDLGTNGEIVLGSSDYLMTCACSAGPAFEGGDIACGMRATDGAIEKCVIDAETMTPAYSVVGAEGAAPVGICGSGLIDIVAELFRCGIIDAKGKFAREGGRITTDEWGITSFTVAFADETEDGSAVYLDDADIDNFIRAKGSLFAAIRTMLEAVGAAPGDIENLFIAGGIGSGINFANAVTIGMLPDIPREKFSYIGNSSLAGAYAALISHEAAGAVDATAAQMTYLELSTYPGYMDELIAACFLPHTDASLFSPRSGA